MDDKNRICPRCGKKKDKLLSLSRKDNQTMICDDCGLEEALEDYLWPDPDRKSETKETK